MCRRVERRLLAGRPGSKARYYERIGNFDPAALRRHIEGIHDNLLEIFARARAEERPTGEVADAIAEERFRR